VNNRIVFFMLIMMLFCSTVVAEESGFGVGVILGEPTGICCKFWTGSNTAIDGAAAWSFADENALHLHADYLFHNFDWYEVEKGKLPFYFGLGGRFKLEKDTKVGIRIPIGGTYIVEGAPLDIFLEIVPVLDLVPGTEFELNGAVGIRYFFP